MKLLSKVFSAIRSAFFPQTEAERYNSAIATANRIVAGYRSEAPVGYDCYNASTQNRFQDLPCSIAVNNNFDTAGSVTRANVANLTPSQLEDLFKPSGLFADMDAWFITAFEMQMCGIKRNGLYDWLMSSARQMGNLVTVQNVDRGPSLLFPFVLARQDSIINDEYWAITSGQAQSGYTGGVTGPLTTGQLALGVAGDRVIRVVSRYGLDLDAKYFLSADRIFILSQGGNGVSQRGQWKVLSSAAEVATHPSYVDVLITSENSGSSTAWNSAPTTAAVVLMGANNVSDWESYCLNRPTRDPRKRVPFWYQTMRRARVVDSEYEKVLARLMASNKYFQQFGDLPLAERNRQDEEMFQRAWLRTFFFGKPINSNQTMANWQSLPEIDSIQGSFINTGLQGKIVARRANMVGVREQLLACGQVFDLQNNNLNWYEWLTNNYNIMRSRKTQGKNVTDLDWFTDSAYAGQMETAMVNYLIAEYGNTVRIVIEKGTNELGFSWRTFEVKFPAGIKINVISHEFFDDIVNAMYNEGGATGSALASAGRLLLCLEMGKSGPKGGTIYPGMIATNRKVRTLGELENMARIDPTYACTMEVPTERINLTSETCTAVVECPSNSAWIEGIPFGVPSTAGLTANATYTNLYGFAWGLLLAGASLLTAAAHLI